MLILLGARHGVEVGPASRRIQLHVNLCKIGLGIVKDTGFNSAHIGDSVWDTEDGYTAFNAEAMMVRLARVTNAAVGLEFLLSCACTR